MLAHKFEDKIKNVKYPGYVQPKLDGMRCTASDLSFHSRTCKPIISVPKLLLEVNENFDSDIILDGELFTKDENFESIMSSVRRTVNIVENPKIEYWIYDAVFKKSIPFERRAKEIQKMFNSISDNEILRVKLVPTIEVSSYDAVMHWFKVFLEQGYEGLIFRNADSHYTIDNRSYNLLKLKPWKDCEAKVIGFQEGAKRLRGSLGALLCELDNGKIVKCGSGFTDLERDAIWYNQSDHLNRIVTIKYQELTKNKIPRFPTFLRWAN